MSAGKKVRSLRVRITFVSVLFTLVLCAAFCLACFFFFRGYARTSVLQSAEFNLQMAAQLAGEDLAELNSLAGRLALQQPLVSYLTDDAPSSRQALTLYEDMADLAGASRSYQYLQRFLVTDGRERFVQGGTPTYSIPLNKYNLSSLPGVASAEVRVWRDAFHDPLFPASAPDSLLSVHPVRRLRVEGTAGVVYLTASARLFTDRLSDADTETADRVYLNTDTGRFLLSDGRFIPETIEIAYSRRDDGAPRYSATVIEDVRTAGGEEYTLVTCPVPGSGLSLTHAVPAARMFATDSVLWLLLLCIAALVIAMGAALFLYLDRVIVRPVECLQQRIQRVAGGDFSADPTIEWPDELGDVGRGVNRLARDVCDLMERRVADEQERQGLEYKMLQSQVNPHFIYNTLNSIKWMATIQGASGIAEMTTAFARLLKSVAKGNRPLHTLREEFALLNDYCTIQRYRYGGAITVEIAEISDEGLCECLIPSFTLQPLAENAVFHGIEPKGGAGSVWLRIRREEEGDVVITMEDDGVGMEPEAVRKIFEETKEEAEPYSQIGLRNVHRRIQYAFGPQYGLSIESQPGEYTRVEIRIPYRPRPKEAAE